MKTRLGLLALCVIVVMSSMIIAAQETEEPMQEGATAIVQDVDGEQLGSVIFIPIDGQMLVSTQLGNLPPGIHGFHVHEFGSCESTDEGPFTAAGKHLNPTGEQHPNHIGDLAALFVNQDGTAYMSFATDRLTMADLLDDDGSAIIVHALPDNYAHIPERYGGPDEESLSSGDSGEHIACGVLEAGMSEAIFATPEATAAG